MNGLIVVLPLALLLVAVITQLAVNGVIKRNGFAGIRIPSTLSGDEAWLAGHIAAVVPTWVGFAVAVVASTGEFLSGGSRHFLIATVVAFVATVAFSLYAASRAARAVRSQLNLRR